MNCTTLSVLSFGIVDHSDHAGFMRAVEPVCGAGIVTPDLGNATTQVVTRAVGEAVRGANLPEGTAA